MLKSPCLNIFQLAVYYWVPMHLRNFVPQKMYASNMRKQILSEMQLRDALQAVNPVSSAACSKKDPLYSNPAVDQPEPSWLYHR